MSKIKGTNIAAPIVPYATNDSYPTHYAKYGKGGFVSLKTLNERDEIPAERLEEGMLVYVLEDGQSYQYLGGEWVPAKVGKEDSLRFEGSTNYNARVENGIVVAYNELPTYRLQKPKVKGEYCSIRINSFYLGYDTNNNPHNFLPCSHRFIELSNIGTEEMSLSGLFLKLYFNGNWETIELNGVINPGSTYLVRGEQVSVIDAETTKIKVKQFNQDWLRSNHVNTSGGLMIYLCWGNEDGQVLDKNGRFIDEPSTREDIYNSLSFVDCVSTNSSTSITGTGIVKSNSQVKPEDIIYVRKCPLDPSYIDTKDNAVDWRYHIINDDRYRPGASYEGKDMSWGNDWLKNDGSPITVTCTVGRNAAIDHLAKRCFTWTTKDSDCEYLFIRKIGATAWNIFPGIYGNPSLDHDSQLNEADIRNQQKAHIVNRNVEISDQVLRNPVSGEWIPQSLFNYYNRAAWETYTGEVVYTYRAIITIYEEGIYEYKCGKSLSNSQVSASETKYFHIANLDSGKEPSYIQIGNYNIDTYESSVLLWHSSKSMPKYTPSTNTRIETIGADFLVNTGNIVKHGTRPQEWIYYINNNNLLKYYAEFITPGENDLGEINLYDVGSKKVNYRLFDLFYTFEYNVENLPQYYREEFDDYILMPGLYSTTYAGHLLISLNSTVLTNPDKSTSETTTTRDVMHVEDKVPEDMPSENDKLGIPSWYYIKELEWLYREIYYNWNYTEYQNLPIFSSQDFLGWTELMNAPFTRDSIDHGVFLPDFTTVITNRAPIEPYTDILYDHREEGGEITRSADSTSKDNLNFHTYFLTSRLFKLWQIKTVLSNNNWGIAGVTKRVHDANDDYAPPAINTAYKSLLINPMEAYDTYQPVFIVEDSDDASKMASTQQARYIWNGSSYTLYISYQSGGYTSIGPGEMEASGLTWNGRYSIFMAGRDSAEYRENICAPRYIYLNSSLNNFSMYNEETGETYDWTNATAVKPWFEGYIDDSTYPFVSKMQPTYILHELYRAREESSSDQEGPRALTFNGIVLKRGTTTLDLSKWNLEESLQLTKDQDPKDVTITASTSTLLSKTIK